MFRPVQPDYRSQEEMKIQSFDHSDIPENSRVAIYGAGVRGIHAAQTLMGRRKDLVVACFLDSHTQGEVMGLERRLFTGPASVRDVDLVLVASAYLVTICNHVLHRGVDARKIAIPSIPEEFFPRQAMVSHGHKFVYVPNTKVAHTSFRSALGKYSENGLENLDFTAPEYDGYFKFSVVRSPYSRFVSMFNDKIQNRAYRAFFKHFTPGSAAFTDVLRALVSMKQGASDPHWIPQSYSIWTPERGVVVDRLYRMEELGDALNELQERLNIPIKLPRLNNSRKTLRMADLSEADRHLLRDYYARDFEILGYGA